MTLPPHLPPTAPSSLPAGTTSGVPSSGCSGGAAAATGAFDSFLPSSTPVSGVQSSGQTAPSAVDSTSAAGSAPMAAVLTSAGLGIISVNTCVALAGTPADGQPDLLVSNGQSETAATPETAGQVLAATISCGNETGAAPTGVEIAKDPTPNTSKGDLRPTTDTSGASQAVAEETETALDLAVGTVAALPTGATLPTIIPPATKAKAGATAKPAALSVMVSEKDQASQTAALTADRVTAEADADSDSDTTGEADPVPASSTDKTAAVILAYQFVAGQWIPQTPVPEVPLKVASAGADAIGSAAAPAAATPPGTAGTAQAMPVATAAQVDATASLTSAVSPTKPMASSKTGRAASLLAANVAAPLTDPTAAAGTTSSDAAKTVSAFDGKSGFPIPASEAADQTESARTVSSQAKPSPVANAAEDARSSSESSTVQTPAAQSQGASSAPSSLANANVQPVAEKFAASRVSSRAETASGGISLNANGEKKSVVNDSKKVSEYTKNIGMDVANREISTMSNSANKTLPAAAALPVHTGTAAGHLAETVKTSSVPSTDTTQAVRLVNEIHDIADRISVVDRNSVEVRFDFNESDRLSVRVEYKDGVVHTTFNTDSSQVREAVSQAWNSQSSNAESRGYRMADPVFTANNESAQQGLGSRGDNSGQSRSQEQAGGSTGFAFSSTGRPAASGSSSSTATSARPAVRPETSRHLHTFA